MEMIIKLLIILILNQAISQNIVAQEIFKNETEKKIFLYQQSVKSTSEIEFIGKKDKLLIDAEIPEFEILDSFNLNLRFLHDLTYGNGYLWIIKSSELEFDTIFKINPENGVIVNAYEIPVPKSYWSQALTWDSISSGGPYLWFSTDNPINEIYKLRVSDFEILESYKSPENYPYGLDFKEGLLWISMGNDWKRKLLTFNQNGELYDTIINLPYSANRITFCSKKSLLWIEQSDIWLDSNYIYLFDIFTGNRLKCFYPPGPNTAGLALDNFSFGGPYLWISDFKNGNIYKIKEPIVEISVNDSNNNDNLIILQNPFNATTKLILNIKKVTPIKLNIYDFLGKHIINLADSYLKENKYEFTFDGSALASGTYYYVLQAGGRVESGKLVLIK